MGKKSGVSPWSFVAQCMTSLVHLLHPGHEVGTDRRKEAPSRFLSRFHGVESI